MSNKKIKEEKEAKEEQRIAEVQKDYETYVSRIQKRIELQEEIEIKPFENWVRKVKKTIDGIEQEIELSGDTGETGAEKFKRLVEKRMIKALDSLDLIINLSAPQYESTEKQQIQVVNALRLKVLDIENSFKVREKKEEKFILEA